MIGVTIDLNINVIKTQFIVFAYVIHPTKHQILTKNTSISARPSDYVNNLVYMKINILLVTIKMLWLCIQSTIHSLDSQTYI